MIILIDTESPRVAVWRRDGNEWHYREKTGLDAVIELPEVEVTLPLSALYLDLSFDQAEG